MQKDTPGLEEKHTLTVKRTTIPLKGKGPATKYISSNDYSWKTTLLRNKFKLRSQTTRAWTHVNLFISKFPRRQTPCTGAPSHLYY